MLNLSSSSLVIQEGIGMRTVITLRGGGVVDDGVAVSGDAVETAAARKRGRIMVLGIGGVFKEKGRNTPRAICFLA